MNTLIAFLTAFIVANSDLPRTEIAPIVQFESRETLWYMNHPGATYRPERQKYAALYRNDFIYLHADWSASDLGDVSTLMHELVHHLQAHSDKFYPCAPAEEGHAFALQIDFVQRLGEMTHEEALEEIGLGALYLHQVTQCPPPWAAP